MQDGKPIQDFVHSIGQLWEREQEQILSWILCCSSETQSIQRGNYKYSNV